MGRLACGFAPFFTGCAILLLSGPSLEAGETFRYRYGAGDTISYSITIDSIVKLRKPNELAAMLGLENARNLVNVDIDLVVESVSKDGRASMQGIVKRANMQTIVGMNVYTEDGSSMGGMKPGTRYKFEVTPQGEISRFVGGDSITASQGQQLIQRFFPVFPAAAIDIGYVWSDSQAFSLELPGRGPTQINSVVTYKYSGLQDLSEEASGGNLPKFTFDAEGNSETEPISLSGSGDVLFDRRAGRVVKNSGEFGINADMDLAAFGVPQDMSQRIPVHIQSKIEIGPPKNPDEKDVR